MTTRPLELVRRGAVLLAILAACGGTTAPGTGASSKDLGAVSSSADPNVAPATAFDGTGAPAVAYYESGNLTVKTWDGARWNGAGGGIAPSSLPRDLSLVFDGASLVIVWTDEMSGTYTIHAARLQGGAWTPLAGQVSPTGVPSFDARPAVGPQGLFVAYLSGNPYVAAAVSQWTGTQWVTWPATPSQNAASLSFALTPAGWPVVSWVGSQVSQSGTVWTVSMREWDSGASAWTAHPEMQFSSQTTVATVVSADGTVYASVDPGSPELKYLKPGSSSWSSAGKPPGALITGGILVMTPKGVTAAFVAPGGLELAAWGDGWTSLAPVGDLAAGLAVSAQGQLAAAWLTSPGSSAPTTVRAEIVN